MLGLPIISTSANRHGEAPCKSAAEVQKTMGSVLDYIIEGEKGLFERPSTIIDLCSGKTIRP
jgi:L-threonylcarbamoyladenylate synthase